MTYQCVLVVGSDTLTLQVIGPFADDTAALDHGDLEHPEEDRVVVPLTNPEEDV